MYIYNEDAARAIYEDRSRSLRKDAEEHRLVKRRWRIRRRGGRYAAAKPALPRRGVASEGVAGALCSRPGIGV
ncbi:hypothetical protein [Phytoactinopolyspora mesophila]|uniref:Uncharacterized protein n=1 Tax=Phytoactinopolyspora mesophila TaxID=2650750 RepID=A0A7K3M9G5_9ACTN|nr:hypothetical protein [Phytoactinopolyspora mesophila]NDL59637.1 hypothetical protein [Phytoactinopolyspora mesophila]